MGEQRQERNKEKIERQELGFRRKRTGVSAALGGIEEKEKEKRGTY